MMQPIRTFSVVVTLCVGGGAFAAPVGSLVGSVKLKGVDPAFYLQKRNHRPDVSAELKGLPVEVSLAVLRDPGVFVVDAGQKPEQRALEVRALRQGALTALAASGDARAVAVLTSNLDDNDVAVAAVAAERLGETGADSVVAVLGALLTNDAKDSAVRAGAAAGLGRHRSAAALQALLPGLDKVHGDDVQRATLHGLASLSSRWAWQAKGDEKTGNALRAQALAAALAVDGSAEVLAARDGLLAMLR